jgi:GntR family transcriptional regulator
VVPVPDFSDPTPARKQIAEDLREQIRAGKYAPGSRLPSNLALSKHYRVAPETVRAALAELGGDGLVVTQSTRGTFVVSRPPASGEADLKAAGERLTELAERVEGYADLRAWVAELEANVMDLYNRFGFEYPHGGEHDSEEKPSRRRRAGR